MEIVGKLEKVAKRHAELEKLLSDPSVTSDNERYVKLSREHAELTPVVEAFAGYKKIGEELKGSQELFAGSDPELRTMAEQEIPGLEKRLADAEAQLKLLLLPKEPNDGKNAILELRAGTGGDEAGLFVADLFRMYSRYAEPRKWKAEILSASENSAGGYKELIAQISGKDVFSRLKFESGVHRVQRVPATETQGRIHTSTATVAVLPEAEDLDIVLRDDDLRIDVFRAGGHGGQSVNTTDSAVRVTHLPTNTVVICQDEKSQIKNKAKAIKILKSRLLARAEQEQHDRIASERRSLIGSGMRSEKIRTYNFPQERCTDHRIGLTLYQLSSIIDGDLDPLIDPLTSNYQAELLARETEPEKEKSASERP